MMWMHARSVLFAGAIALPAGLVPAQTTTDRPTGTQSPQTTTQMQRSTGQQQQQQQASQLGSAASLDRQTQQQLIQLLRQANEGEVELARLAQERAQNDRVRQFAQRMQQEHSQFIQQLDRVGTDRQAMGGSVDSSFDANRSSATMGDSTFGGTGAASGSAGIGEPSASERMGASATVSTDTRAAGASDVSRERGASSGPNAGIGERSASVTDRDATTGAGSDIGSAYRSGEADRPVTAGMQGAAGADLRTSGQGTTSAGLSTGADASDRSASEVYGFAAAPQGQLPQVLQELHRQHMQSTRQMLSEKQGTEFDKAYMGTQKMMHQQMLDKLQVFSRYVSQDAQSVLQQGQQATQQHLQDAREIMRELERQG